ncbi:MAG: hypothetical protein ACYTG4_12070 [Planctomycetota bacterium]|jgi:hypothetical protein
MSDDTTTGDTRPPWRRPGVILWCVIIAVLLSVPLWLVHVRNRGKNALNAVFAQHEAEGLGGSPDHLLDGLREIDRTATAEFLAELMGAANGLTPPVLPYRERTEWVLGRVEEPSPKLTVNRDARTATIATCIRVLSPGNVGASAPYHLRRTFPDGRYPAARVVSMGVPNLIAARNISSLLRIEALMSDDPVPALQSLDGLIAAFEPPGLLITGMIAISLRGERDGGYLDCAILGNVTEEQARGWLDDERREVDLVADSMAGERLLFAGSIARGIRVGTLPGGFWGGGGGGGKIPLVGKAKSGFDRWLHGARDMAYVISQEGGMEKALRARQPMPRVLPGDAEGIAAIALPNLESIFGTAVDGHARARLHRLAARVVFLARAKGRLPANDAELRAWMGDRASLLDGEGIERKLLYNRSAPERFQLQVDPTVKAAPIWKSVRTNETEVDVSQPLSVPYRTTGRAIDVQLRPAPAGK